MKEIYYGQIAYEGFARAYGARHGVTVTVKPGASPSVNAQGEITLPSMDKYQTAQEFERTCAAVIHEVSHVVYGSHQSFATHANRDVLFRDCLNAVMDVCDETAIGAKEHSNGNRRPEQLLVSANAQAWNDTYGFRNHPKHACILCSGIVKARLGARTRIGNRTIADIPEVDVRACYRVLGQARLPEGSPRRPSNVKLAERLVKLLAPVAPPVNDSPAVMPVSGKLDPNAQEGESSLPAGSVEATEQNGVDVAEGAGASSYVETSPDVQYSAAHDALLPSIRRIAQRMATDGDSIMRDEGYTSGAGVSQAFRLFTDGNCMGRWHTNEHADGMSVAILLDDSGSMCWQIAECAGLADAFAEGMREYATVKCWGFGNRVTEKDSFKVMTDGGGTGTAKAIRAANEWLKSREGKRVTVIITDGQPDSITDCQAASLEAPGKIIGIALNTPARYLQESMPDALVIEAADTSRLAMELDYIGHQLAGQS